MLRNARCGDSGVSVDLKASDRVPIVLQKAERDQPSESMKRVSRFDDKFSCPPVSSAKEEVVKIGADGDCSFSTLCKCCCCQRVLVTLLLYQCEFLKFWREGQEHQGYYTYW
jgi:hypothetical protein